MDTWLFTLGDVDPVDLLYRQQEADEYCRQLNKLQPDACTSSFGVINAVLGGAFLAFVAWVWWAGRKRRHS